MAKTWFITGVSSGLGRALAEAALSRGDRVAGTVRTEAAKIRFEATGEGRAIGHILDVQDHLALGAAIEASIGPGGLDVLVNNAGYGLICPFEEASLEDIRLQFEVNVFAPIAAAQAALPSMRARGRGRIINISSVSGLAPWAGTSIYTSSKFALEGAMRTLAQEIAPFNLFVTNIEPGAIRTNFAKGSMRSGSKTPTDYGGPASAAAEILADGAGRERGDPMKMAAAILKVADLERPPLQLLLGEDAVHYATRELARFQEEMGEWIALSLGVGGEGP